MGIIFNTSHKKTSSQIYLSSTAASLVDRRQMDEKITVAVIGAGEDAPHSLLTCIGMLSNFD